MNQPPHPTSPQSIHELRGPPGLPILGNLHQLTGAFHLTLEEWCRRYGPVSRFKVASKTYVLVSDPALIQSMLKERPDKFRRMSRIDAVFSEAVGTGLFSAEGETWRRHRRLTAPAFHNANLKQFFATQHGITGRLERRWLAAAREGRDVEVPPDLLRYAVDVTTSLAFATDINSLERGPDPLQNAFEQLVPAVARRVHSPFPYWRYIKLPADRALDRALALLRRELGQIIEECRKRLASSETATPANYLEALLLSRDEDGSALSEAEIFANAVTILGAGEDTTASSLAWVLRDLVRYPEVQQKMREEADRVLGSSHGLQSFEDSLKLPYIEAVIFESMRLKPVTPFLFLEALQEARLGDLVLPAGTELVLVMSVGAKSDEHFTRAAEFLPERWLAEQRPAEWKHNLKAYLPFGGGARMCPGRNLSLLEMKSVAAMVSRRFSVLPPRNQRVPTERFTFALTPVDFWVKLEERGSA